MNHTKGPYRVARFEREDGGETLFIKQDKGKADFSGFILAQMADGTGNDEGNAQLLAAAPDLLEVCERVLHLIRNHQAYDKDAQSLLERALAKAKGES